MSQGTTSGRADKLLFRRLGAGFSRRQNSVERRFSAASRRVLLIKPKLGALDADLKVRSTVLALPSQFQAAQLRGLFLCHTVGH